MLCHKANKYNELEVIKRIEMCKNVDKMTYNMLFKE